jgi:hypothetical protein
MPRFKKHYTREEARQLLPQVRRWLDELASLRDQMQERDENLAKELITGQDLGGELVNRYMRCVAAVKQLLLQFHRREIQIKDLDRGLIDFPAYIGGNEVFLCWEKGEEDIEFWHDLHSGFAGREPLD